MTVHFFGHFRLPIGHRDTEVAQPPNPHLAFVSVTQWSLESAIPKKGPGWVARGSPSVFSVATNEAEWSKHRRLVYRAGIQDAHGLLPTTYSLKLHPIATREENRQSISAQCDRA